MHSECDFQLTPQLRNAGVLKDVPDFPLVMVYSKEADAKRLSLFPSLDYKGLHTVIVQLIEVMTTIQTGIDGN